MHQVCLLHCPPEIQPVLPSTVETEQRPNFFMLQTIHFDSPSCSTSSFWQDRDSWLKNNEENLPGMTELLYLVQAEEEEGSALQSSLHREEPPLFPISIQHQSLYRDCEWAPGQPPVMCICAFSQTRTISVPNRRRTNRCVRNNKYPVPYPASLLCPNEY